VSDDKLKAAYSALPREEPGAAIDDAILAASRRAVARPSASRRWAAPVSIAAVLVLAFGVTLHMKEDKSAVESPDMYGAPPAAVVEDSPPPRMEDKPPEPVLQKKAAPRPQAKPERKDLAPAPQAKLRAAPAEEALVKESNVRQAPMPAAPPAPAAAPAAAPPPAAARMKREAFSATAPAGIAADAQVAADEPTRELEAIAKLRAEGRHEEADKALEEFRRKRPGYRIPEAMWERVRPR
jgi:hypothetical protein